MILFSSHIDASGTEMWVETEVFGGNPRDRVSDHNTLLHTTTADPEVRTRSLEPITIHIPSNIYV